MTAVFTVDLLCTLDGFGSYTEDGDWGGFWSKQGPEFLSRRLAQYGPDTRLVLGARTYRQFVEMLGPSSAVSETDDPVNHRMVNLPTTVVSSTLTGPLDWPNATSVAADAVDVVTRLKAGSDAPLRSHGSLTLNHSLMAAGLVDRLQVTIFPVISGRTGSEPIFQGAGDFDLELLESRTLDGRTLELVYSPTPHS